MKKSKKPKTSQCSVEDTGNAKFSNDDSPVVSSTDGDSPSRRPSKRKKSKSSTSEQGIPSMSNKKRKHSQNETPNHEMETMDTVHSPDSETVSEQPEKILTPAEKAAKKEKREKMKKKKDVKKLRREEQKQQIQASLTPGNVGTAEKEALEYIRQWKSDQKRWKFNKVRQVWLLQHMYDIKRVSDDDFAVILKYLEGLQGKSREVTKEKAEHVITELDQLVSSDEQEMAETDTKLDRARQIIQIL